MILVIMTKQAPDSLRHNCNSNMPTLDAFQTTIRKYDNEIARLFVSLTQKNIQKEMSLAMEVTLSIYLNPFLTRQAQYRRRWLSRSLLEAGRLFEEELGSKAELVYSFTIASIFLAYISE